MIRGKGSVKEGKVVRKDNHPLPGEDEPLHALVSSNCVENVNKAVNEILQIIKQVGIIFYINQSSHLHLKSFRELNNLKKKMICANFS